MLKITINSTLDKVYSFIDRRLILLLAEQKLKVSDSGFWSISKKNIKKNIQNTIYYLEKGSERASIVLLPSEKKDNKSKLYPCGAALIQKNSQEVDLYIDTFHEAIKKGVIDKEKLGNRRKMIGILAGIIFFISMFVFLPIFLAVTAILIIGYPIVYFIQKRKFKHRQQILNKVVQIFESEFSTHDKTDTNDWMNFWMRVKSDVKEVVIP